MKKQSLTTIKLANEKKYLPQILGHALKDKEKKVIERAVAKMVREYGETLRLLGRE